MQFQLQILQLFNHHEKSLTFKYCRMQRKSSSRLACGSRGTCLGSTLLWVQVTNGLGFFLRSNHLVNTEVIVKIVTPCCTGFGLLSRSLVGQCNRELPGHLYNNYACAYKNAYTKRAHVISGSGYVLLLYIYCKAIKKIIRGFLAVTTTCNLVYCYPNGKKDRRCYNSDCFHTCRWLFLHTYCYLCYELSGFHWRQCCYRNTCRPVQRQRMFSAGMSVIS